MTPEPTSKLGVERLAVVSIFASTRLLLIHYTSCICFDRAEDRETEVSDPAPSRLM